MIVHGSYMMNHKCFFFFANTRGAYHSIDRRVEQTVANLTKRTLKGAYEVAVSREGGCSAYIQQGQFTPIIELIGFMVAPTRLVANKIFWIR